MNPTTPRFRFLCFLLGLAVETGVLEPPAGRAEDELSSVVIDNFSQGTDPAGIPSGWKPLHFKKIPQHTLYTVEREGDHGFLKAVSRASASGLYKPLDFDLRSYPVLRWRWRVENILQKADEKTKAGDDYAARVYVTFRYDPDRATLWEKTKYETYRLLYGEYPPSASLNYVWASRLPKGETLISPYTDRSRTIAVESGIEGLGEWREESRNVVEDYRRAFGHEPPPILAIAIMTDTDNTGESAVAYYDDLYFGRE
jgi:hypothetical protein